MKLMITSHFSHSRLEPNVYKPDYKGRYFEQQPHCTGGETDLSLCTQHDSACDRQDYAAGVCCSNSDLFGEMRGDVFISHCVADWLEASHVCDTMGYTLTRSTGYQSGVSNFRPTLVAAGDTPTWAGNFFTPWFWANGCVKIVTSIKGSHRVTLENNSPQFCLQNCVKYSDAFLVSEALCECINSTDAPGALMTVEPAHCKIFCPGDTSRFCGTGSGAYWNLYKITSDDIFFRIRGPEEHAVSQCAVTVKNDFGTKRLASEKCEDDKGYICSRYNATGTEVLLPFTNAGHLVGAQDARTQCPSQDGLLQLVGESIIHIETFYFDYDGLWIDLSRVLTETLPEISVSILRKLNPQYCYSISRDGTRKNVGCEHRYLYTCTVDPAKTSEKPTGDSTPSGGSTSSQPGSTVTSPQSLGTAKVNYGIVSNEVLHLVLIILSAIVVAVIIIFILICWIKRSKGKRSLWCCEREPSSARSNQDAETACLSDLSATFQPGSTHGDNRFEVIRHVDDNKDFAEENIYNEIEEPDQVVDQQGYEVPINQRTSLMEDSGSGSHLETPVSMTRSYSHPRDMIDLGDCADKNSSGYCSEANMKEDHPNYIYPYDKVYRPDGNQSLAVNMNNIKVKAGTSKNDLNENLSKQLVKDKKGFEEDTVGDTIPLLIETESLQAPYDDDETIALANTLQDNTNNRSLALNHGEDCDQKRCSIDSSSDVEIIQTNTPSIESEINVKIDKETRLSEDQFELETVSDRSIDNVTMHTRDSTSDVDDSVEEVELRRPKTDLVTEIFVSENRDSKERNSAS